MFLLVCLVSLSLELHVESSPVRRHFSKYTLCKMSPVGIQNTCSHALCGAFSRFGFHRCWCGTILPGRISQDFRFTAADDRVAESARCCPLRPSRCCAMMFMVSRKIFSLSLSLVLVSCSRDYLLDVSCLLGLTLRHFALVCSCHRDSLTRWRLAIL